MITDTDAIALVQNGGGSKYAWRSGWFPAYYLRLELGVIYKATNFSPGTAYLPEPDEDKNTSDWTPSDHPPHP